MNDVLNPGTAPKERAAPIIREASDADSSAWDSFVTKHPLGTPYHRYAWRQAMLNGYKIKTIYLLAENSKGNICGVLPAARIPRPWGSGKLCSLPYCDRGEALGVNTAVVNKLIEDLHQRVSLPHELRGTAGTVSMPASIEVNTGQKVRMLLELPGSSADLLAGFKSKHRSQINKAKKNGLVADIGNSAKHVAEFYRVFARNMRDLGSPTHSLAWFLSVSEAYADDCSIGLVRSGNNVIGAAIVLRAGDRAAIPWASTLREYNQLAPNMLLYWTMLSTASDSGVTEFDFGRSSVGEGTFRFKQQWGAKPVPLRWQLLNSKESGLTTPTNKTPQHATDTASLRALAESVWRRLPLEVTISLGARIRPFISL